MQTQSKNRIPRSLLRSAGIPGRALRKGGIPSAVILTLLAGASVGLSLGGIPLNQGGLFARDRRITLYEGEGILQIAEKYLGTPYKPGGQSPAGFDCSGFTGYVYKKAGYHLARTADGQYDEMRPIQKPQPGDLVFFRISGKKVSHVGIYAGDLRFIHAPSSGKKVEYADMRLPYWKKRYVGARTVFRQL